MHRLEKVFIVLYETPQGEGVDGGYQFEAEARTRVCSLQEMHPAVWIEAHSVTREPIYGERR